MNCNKSVLLCNACLIKHWIKIEMQLTVCNFSLSLSLSLSFVSNFFCVCRPKQLCPVNHSELHKCSYGNTRWHSWLRQCATSRKVASSIPDSVISIFLWHNPSGCTMEYFPGGKADRCVELKILPLSCADCHEIWEPQPPVTLRACSGLCRDCFKFTFAHVHMSQSIELDL